MPTARPSTTARSTWRGRAGTLWLAAAIAANLPAIAVAAPAPTTAPTTPPAAEEPATPEPTPSDPADSGAVEPSTEGTAPAPTDTPPAQPESAGPTPPSDTTRKPPITADTKSIGSRSPRPNSDGATVLEGTPDRMRPMQKAGWWTLFGGFVFATVGGVFSGLAERQEDKAERLAVRFDLETSAQPLYEDVRADYDKIVDRGQAYANTAIALGVLGGALAVTGITLLAVDEVRTRKQGKRGKRRARLDLRRGMQVRF